MGTQLLVGTWNIDLHFQAREHSTMDPEITAIEALSDYDGNALGLLLLQLFTAR